VLAPVLGLVLGLLVLSPALVIGPVLVPAVLAVLLLFLSRLGRQRLKPVVEEPSLIKAKLLLFSFKPPKLLSWQA
jgi:hypothetical protein